MANETSLFLTRLSLDVPEYYLCSICSRLHLWRTFPLPALFKETKCFRLMSGHSEYWLVLQPMARPMWPFVSPYELHFTHAQLAMRRFSHGPKYGISTDSLFYIGVSTRPCDYATYQPENASASKPKARIRSEIRTFLTSCEARISQTAPSLCLRIQVWSVVNRPYINALLPIEMLCGFAGTSGLRNLSTPIVFARTFQPIALVRRSLLNMGNASNAISKDALKCEILAPGRRV